MNIFKQKHPSYKKIDSPKDYCKGILGKGFINPKDGRCYTEEKYEIFGILAMKKSDYLNELEFLVQWCCDSKQDFECHTWELESHIRGDKQKDIENKMLNAYVRRSNEIFEMIQSKTADEIKSILPDIKDPVFETLHDKIVITPDKNTNVLRFKLHKDAPKLSWITVIYIGTLVTDRVYVDKIDYRVDDELFGKHVVFGSKTEPLVPWKTYSQMALILALETEETERQSLNTSNCKL